MERFVQEAKLSLIWPPEMHIDYWIVVSVFCSWSACCSLMNCIKRMLFQTPVLPKLTIELTS